MNAGQATQAAFDARADIDGVAVEPQHESVHEASASWQDGDIRLTIHEGLAGLERDWRAFEQHADCTVFQTFEWLSIWQRHIGLHHNARPAIVVGRDAAGEMLFLLPLAIEASGFLRRLTWLGSDLCDYNGPLLAPDFSRQVDAERFARIWRDIARRLRDHPRLGYDLVSFDKMPEQVGAQDNPFMHIGVTVHPSGAYLTRLTGDWEAFYTEKRSSATRRRDRTKRKKLGEFGDVRFVTMDGGVDTAPALDTLMTQKAQQFAAMGVANLFARPGYPAFYRDIATDMATRHIAHVSRLDVGAVPAAINLGLMFRGRYYHVLASYDGGGEMAKFGPGAAHLHDLMRYAIEQGCTIFDFTVGDERYKRDWSDTELKFHDHLSAATPRGWPAVVAILAFHGLKRWIKQTPMVWNAFSKARAALGAMRASRPEA